MNRTIPQTILSLLPTLNSAELPPPLIDLAGSLLSQSRHLLSSLKADEEIARTYACAHIACDRLKTSLNLPPIEPRPPIPPRVYKRLYTHLDSILPIISTPNPRSGARGKNGAVTTPSSVRFRDALVESPSSGRRGARGERPTPSKEQTLAQFRSSGTGGKGSARTPANDQPGSLANTSRSAHHPPWLRPTARFVCADLEETRVLPFVMAGLDAIVTPYGKPTNDEWVQQNMTALLAAIVFYSTRAAANNAANATANGEGAAAGNLSNEQYKIIEKRLLNAIAKARREVVVPGAHDASSGHPGQEGDADGNSKIDAWSQWSDLKARGLKQALMVVNDRKWLEDDWFRGIDDLTDAQVLADSHSTDNSANDGVQLRRADTMLQERHDYLSERRRRDYRIWKAQILKKMSVLEQTSSIPMEVDS
ncbi:hypothetical protein PpBr36_04379 [Pyricularia pennisetigena]|uniref:hypothetical protein n=1 Tax=Pyricularia pennisetigena TaxID=1578925 RepID=UPI001152CE9F|nr:hypothetical protein PpBr36_04379 [Pyricularia pennisetigena]TLS27494.1 hypothetical protein PpBr36_04379 [Pyricularia pennisetigena]